MYITRHRIVTGNIYSYMFVTYSQHQTGIFRLNYEEMLLSFIVALCRCLMLQIFFVNDILSTETDFMTLKRAFARSQ